MGLEEKRSKKTPMAIKRGMRAVGDNILRADAITNIWDSSSYHLSHLFL
jgi:hypothetical protein